MNSERLRTLLSSPEFRETLRTENQRDTLDAVLAGAMDAKSLAERLGISEQNANNRLTFLADKARKFYEANSTRYSEKRGSGYDGYSMSNNARAAYENNEMPLSKWSKNEILRAAADIDPEKAELLKKVKLPVLRKYALQSAGWHHTSSMYNRTDFYGINSDFIEELTPERSEELASMDAGEENGNKLYRGDFEYLAWSGTRAHPKANEVKLEDVNIEERGKFYYVYDDNGELLVKKLMTSNGTYAHRTGEYRASNTAEQNNAEEEKTLGALREEMYQKYLDAVSEKRNSEKRIFDNTSPAAREFLGASFDDERGFSIDNGKVERTTKKQHAYLLGRKPTTEDYKNGLENFFHKGEQRAARNEQGGYSIETWNGKEWVGESGADYSEKKYTLKNAIASKPGYTVASVNENSGTELNNSKGVVCSRINQVFDPAEAPKEKFIAWITAKVNKYMTESGMINTKVFTPAIGKGVSLEKSTAQSLGNHGGPNEKYNIIPVIPEMLENAVKIQTEVHKDPKGNAVNSYSHLLASKVRYGGERYIAAMVIHENDNQVYYDHSITLLKEKEADSVERGDAATATPVTSNSASVLNVVRNALMSSGFDYNNKKNTDFSEKKTAPRKQVKPTGATMSEEASAMWDGLMEDAKYRKETVAGWLDKAKEWITSRGGINNALNDLVRGYGPVERHVRGAAIQHIMANGDIADREKLQKVMWNYIDEGTMWGKEGASRRKIISGMGKIEQAKYFFHKLDRDMPDRDKTRLRNDIKAKFGVDIFDLDNETLNNRSKLDAILREVSSGQAGWLDKAYEFWINSILSGPKTHAANIAGNTVNAAYELGVKRFAEAVINSVARRKDGATFGEFREMWRHFDFRTAWKNANFELEMLSGDGKLDSGRVAIGGKKGRIIRIPTRLLQFADELAKGIVTPMESAAYAYRQGKAKLKNAITELCSGTRNPVTDCKHNHAHIYSF